MRRRQWSALCLAGAAATMAALSPGASARAAFSVTADADASSYSTGAITDKTWVATLSGGDLKAITFQQPVAPQLNGPAAIGLLTVAPVGTPLGTVTVVLPNGASPLALETGPAAGCMAPAGSVNVDAPASEWTGGGDSKMGQFSGVWRIKLGDLGTVLKVTCVGVRVDALAPGVLDAGDPGWVKITVDITPVSNVAIPLHFGPVLEADLSINNVPVGMAGNLFNANPDGTMGHKPWSIVDTITVTPCVATQTMDVPPVTIACGGAGTAATNNVTETIGGSTGVTATLSASTITYGASVTVSGVVRRGVATSVGEEVDVYHSVVGAVVGMLSVTPSSGAYSIVIPTVRKSGTIDVSARSAAANTLYSSALHLTVLAPKPALAKKVVLKAAKGGTYNVTMTINAVSGITYSAKLGTKALTATRSGRTVVFTGKGLKLKKGSTATVTAAASGITKTTATIKLK